MALATFFNSVEGWIILALFFLFSLSGGITAIVFLNRLRWPFKVTILEKVDGVHYQAVGKDRARLIKFGDGGEEIFFLKRRKKYRVGYGKRIGRKWIGWAIAEDGYWYNYVWGDLDKRLLEVGVIPVDRDVRLANVSLRKGIENRYNEKNFFEKWGVPITIGMLIIAIIIQAAALWFILDKLAQTGATLNVTSEANRAVMELAERILARVDIIQGGTS